MLLKEGMIGKLTHGRKLFLETLNLVLELLEVIQHMIHSVIVPCGIPITITQI